MVYMEKMVEVLSKLNEDEVKTLEYTKQDEL